MTLQVSIEKYVIHAKYIQVLKINSISIFIIFYLWNKLDILDLNQIAIVLRNKV